MYKKYIAIDKNLLLETYEKCDRSLNKTAKALNVSSKTIMRRMKEFNIEWDKKIIYSFDENFFDELNEKSLYWLGMLATDGCVYNGKYHQYLISLKLATKDINLLKLFKDDINFNGPIHSFIASDKKSDAFKQKEYYCSQISIHSKKIFNRLSEFNIVPNKTHIYRLPGLLRDNLDIRHFIRGCIDGDGWIREHCNNGSLTPTEVRIGLCGTKFFIQEIFLLIKEKLNIAGGSCYEKKGGKNHWNFEFSGLHDVDKIIDWLYKDASSFLERKYNIGKKAKEFASRYIKIIKQPNINGKYNFDNKKKLYEYNYDFFNLENELSYYWGGFLAGKSTYVKNKYLAFNCSDKKIIDIFLKDSQMNINIVELKKKNKSIIYQINIFDKIILSQLEKFNINKNKLNDYFIPDSLLLDKNISHFLRGYLDARSGLTLYKNKISLNIKNSEKFLNQINELFKNNCNIELTAKIKLNQITYLTNQAKSILNFLYKDSTIHLQRKYDIIKNYLNASF